MVFDTKVINLLIFFTFGLNEAFKSILNMFNQRVYLAGRGEWNQAWIWKRKFDRDACSIDGASKNVWTTAGYNGIAIYQSGIWSLYRNMKVAIPGENQFYYPDIMIIKEPKTAQNRYI